MEKRERCERREMIHKNPKRHFLGAKGEKKSHDTNTKPFRKKRKREKKKKGEFVVVFS